MPKPTTPRFSATKIAAIAGDPAAATPANGAKMLDVTVEALAAFYGAYARMGLKVGTDRPR